MKSKFTYLVIVLLLLRFTSFADIILPNTHVVSYCAKIDNIKNYPNLTVVACEDSWLNFNSANKSFVTNCNCLKFENGKYSRIKIFAFHSNYLSGKDISTIDFDRDKNALKANFDITPLENRLDNSNPIISQEVFYKIVGFTDTSVVLYKWKETFGFNNGREDSVVTYNYSGNVAELSQTVNEFITNTNMAQLQDSFGLALEGDNLKLQLINSYKGNLVISLHSILGDMFINNLHQKNSNEFNYEVNVANLSSGVYVLKVQYRDAIETKKIFITKQ